MLTRILILCLVFFPGRLLALQIEGVELPSQVTLLDPNDQISLNGAGVRTKFVFNIYVGALYLKKKSDKVDAILKMPGQKRIAMHFLYEEVAKEKLVDGWIDGFKNNNNAETFKALQERLNQFNKLFVTMKKGDVIYLDYLPGIGTEVRFNDDLKGMIPGEDFFQALLKVWLGENPADDSLKRGMLGLDGE
ncbi:MAG: chalcone isomerase family protein [Gammaproteobacteria bacterium]|nr:chalcone isomerase family protein [Gammaproteobacteria bacterium]